MKTKFTLRNRQQQRIIFTRKLIIAGSSVLGVAAAIVVVLNTTNVHSSFARGSEASNSSGVVNAAITPANSAKSAGTAIPINSISLNSKKAKAPFASKNTFASKTIMKNASANAAFSDAKSKNAAMSKDDAAAKMRMFVKAYNAKEKEFLDKVKQRNLTLASQSDAATENDEVLNNSDPAEAVNRSFVVTYVPDSITAEILDFNAERTAKRITVKWATGVEKNNSYFTLERSNDGANFEELAKIDAKGNTLEKSDYKYIDKHPLTGKNYYRLKHTDKAGKAEYFQENIVEP